MSDARSSCAWPTPVIKSRSLHGVSNPVRMPPLPPRSTSPTSSTRTSSTSSSLSSRSTVCAISLDSFASASHSTTRQGTFRSTSAEPRTCSRHLPERPNRPANQCVWCSPPPLPSTAPRLANQSASTISSHRPARTELRSSQRNSSSPTKPRLAPSAPSPCEASASRAQPALMATPTILESSRKRSPSPPEPPHTSRSMATAPPYGSSPTSPTSPTPTYSPSPQLSLASI